MRKILFFQWDAFMQKGMEAALKRLEPRLGITVDTFFYRMGNWDEDSVLYEKLKNAITSSKGVDTLLMVNFCPVVSDVCQELGVEYVSWIYDCPLHIRRTGALANDCNRLYFFDRVQAEEYQSQGIANAYHALLAVDTDIYDKILLSAADRKRYGCDASLVGKLYKTEYESLLRPLNQYMRGYLEGILNAQSGVYGGYFLGELIDAELMEKLNGAYASRNDGSGKVLATELEFTMNCEITGRERYMALALLSNYMSVNVYSGDADERLGKCRFGGYLDYYSQMPRAFKASKVNLNISLKAIQSGIPLRVYDVLGCHGFLLTNYQTELGEHFEDGRELVVYKDMGDLVEKARWYAAHEAERQRIADRGYEKVRTEFTFDRALEGMLA
jgi:spore maturation protein CgeB